MYQGENDNRDVCLPLRWEEAAPQALGYYHEAQQI